MFFVVLDDYCHVTEATCYIRRTLSPDSPQVSSTVQSLAGNGYIFTRVIYFQKKLRHETVYMFTQSYHRFTVHQSGKTYLCYRCPLCNQDHTCRKIPAMYPGKFHAHTDYCYSLSLSVQTTYSLGIILSFVVNTLFMYPLYRYNCFY